MRNGSIPHLPPDRAERRFRDKAPPLSCAEALAEAARCLYCYDAPCIPACPTAIDIPTFIKKIASGHDAGAARTIYRANLLGSSCARVCPVEVLCEGSCVYNADNRTPVAIGRLQRYATDHGGSLSSLLPRRESTGKTVGLVGGGPASLSCAGTLALLGHQPTIYERSRVLGGLNATGVAPYKLLVEEALVEVDAILQLGVRIETGVTIGKDVSGEELLQRHDAVFLGPGLGPDSRLGIPGEEGDGVSGAVAWIERMKTDPTFRLDARHAVVIGGGNTAIDAARELRGLGAASVTIVYRRERGRMSGYDHELRPAQAEGATLLACAAVREIVRRNGAVSEVRLVATSDGQPTDRELPPLPADLVLLAIGQSKLAQLASSFPGVTCDERGRIIADPQTGRTGNPKVFAGGDAFNGGKEVVNAAANGRDAAYAIDAALGQDTGAAHA